MNEVQLRIFADYQAALGTLRRFLGGIGWQADVLHDDELLAICDEIEQLADICWIERNQCARRTYGRRFVRTSKEWHDLYEQATKKLRTGPKHEQTGE